MKTKTLYPALVLGACLLPSAVFAGQAIPDLELARANGCYSCHAAAEKVVGPAFNDVAAKYASDKDAVAGLTQSIKNGSRSKWGRIPMPAHPGLSNEDLKALSTWVMSHKP